MTRSKIFKTRHIKVEVRPPDEKKHLDLTDEYDLQEAKKFIIREWIMIQEQVNEFLSIIPITEKKRSLGLNREDFP